MEMTGVEPVSGRCDDQNLYGRIPKNWEVCPIDVVPIIGLKRDQAW